MMTDMGFFSCPNCEMGFRSRRLLEKHMGKFCIGGETAAATDARDRNRQALHKGKEPKKTETPDSMYHHLQEPKAKKHHLRHWEDQAWEQQAHHSRSLDYTGSISDSQALKKLTEEFHKLRMSLEGTLPTFRSFQTENDNSHQVLHQQEYWQRQQQLAEAHERQLADIQARNQYLEQQKEEIRRCLSELKRGDSATSHIEQLLVELNTQEGKNQLALDALRKQVGLLQAAAESRSKPEPPTNMRADSSVEKMGEKAIIKSVSFPAAVGPLSSEIQALYLAYLQNGGSDHNIINQMYELQMETTALEKAGARPEHKGRKKKHKDSPSTYQRGLDAELLSIELENQRLEDEIFRLKIVRDRRMEDGSLDKELAQQQRVHMAAMAQLHTEIGRMRYDIERMKPRPPRRGSPPLLPPPVAPPLPPPPPHHLRGLPDTRFPTTNMDRVGSSGTSVNQYFLDPSDVLGPAPYDPASGFVIFYDFLLGLDPTFYQVRLVSGLYRNGQELGKPTPLPIVSSDMGQSPQYVMDGQRGSCAILAARQPVPRVLPSTSISLVTELQASGGFDAYGLEIQNLAPRGWTKINIFDHLHQVMSGRWKIPVRVLPVKPGLTPEQLNGVPQASKAELYLRLVNARDADMQSMAEIHPGNAPMYKYAPTVSSCTAPPADFPPAQRPFHPAPISLSFSVPPYTGFVDPPPVQEQPLHLINERGGERALQRPQPQQNSRQPKEGRLLGFILDRVKDAPMGDGAIRLTGYHQKTGQVIVSRDSGLNYCSDSVRSNIKHGYFVFGEQEVTFWDVVPQQDMILVARFYHWPSGTTALNPWDKGSKPQHQPLLRSEEWLAAWAVLELTKLPESHKVMLTGATKQGEPGLPIWNTGTHTLTLYHGPVPPVATLAAMSTEQKLQDFKMYGDATLRLQIFSTQKPELPFPPESPLLLDPAETWPHEAFIHHVRETPPLEPFHSGDGFDLYIDGARFLPDDVTVTKVTARIFTSGFHQIGPDISTGIDLNSSIFDPFYNYSIEIRELVITPCATLLLKVYSTDHSRLILIGWAALNLFVESGTHTVPEPGAKGIQVSLNDGAHQLRIFHNSPCLDQPFSTRIVTSTGRYVPCATLLVRISKAPVDSSHQTLQRNIVPQTNWAKLGLFQPRPDYSDGVYYSDSAKPTAGESCFYKAMANRSVISVREIVHRLAGHDNSLSTDEELSAWIHQKLIQVPGSSPQPFILTYVSKYIPAYGVKFAVDRAMNLSWAGLTMAHFCFNPPGAFYFGNQWLKYDYPIFVEELDINSYQKWPAWLDGFKSCPHRVYHEYSTVIIHLYESVVNPAQGLWGQNEDVHTAQRKIMLRKEQFRHTVGSEAWTALHVFSRGYCNTGIYQLPLYQGSPSQIILASLAQGKCSSIMNSLLHKKVILLVPGASVIVRIADGRWDELRYTKQKLRTCHIRVELACFPTSGH
ncbi:coiled-coil domain-containing protein 17 isoform X3 [Hemicordylus capensis]|uniref:coiled-coil domain-containing protein 17 isoform X3 n=1 Tax=Hemicordylus capensis TaxID=884348 RepID=UPI002303B759|nr:coiled-coil domain-containing protein 17 isoform X3 [Hemicordylus capensis]